MIWHLERGGKRFFFFGICICYTLHVCGYKDVCGRLGDPIGERDDVVYLCVVIWHVGGVVYWALRPMRIIRDPHPLHPPVGLRVAIAMVLCTPAMQLGSSPGPRLLPSFRRWLRLRVCSRVAGGIASVFRCVAGMPR